MSLLEIQNLSVSFSLYGQKLHAVRGISFSLNEGESLGIVGESGSGKSASVQAIARLQPTAKVEGKVLFEGEDLLTKTDAEMRQIRGSKIGMVFQDPMTSLNPTMTIGAQIEEALRCHRLNVKGRALELLKEMEIAEPEARLKQYPHQLSGGMRQRILIAIALSCRPKLLIADELTTALDVTVQAQILQLLRKQSASTSLILITHDLGVVAQTCKRVLVLYGGKIVESGPVDQILHAPRHPYTQMLLRSLPRLEKDKSEALEAIEGSAPNLLMPPSGCPFAERCPHAMPLCQTPPPFVNNTACWMVYQSRPKTWNLGDSEESRFEGSRREGYCINIAEERSFKDGPF